MQSAFMRSKKTVLLIKQPLLLLSTPLNFRERRIADWVNHIRVEEITFLFMRDVVFIKQKIGVYDTTPIFCNG